MKREEIQALYDFYLNSDYSAKAKEIFEEIRIYAEKVHGGENDITYKISDALVRMEQKAFFSGVNMAAMYFATNTNIDDC